MKVSSTYAAAATMLLQSCPTLCDPIDGSPPGSPTPGSLQARTLEWVAIAFSAWNSEAGSLPGAGEVHDQSLLLDLFRPFATHKLWKSAFGWEEGEATCPHPAKSRPLPTPPCKTVWQPAVSKWTDGQMDRWRPTGLLSSILGLRIGREQVSLHLPVFDVVFIS